MNIILCPICNKRVCDSNKSPHIAKLSNSNEAQADLVIKCKNCKNCLAVIIPPKTTEVPINGMSLPK